MTHGRFWGGAPSGDPALDRGLHLGDGVFETILLADGRPQRLDEHLARMRRSAAAFGLRVPHDLDAVLATEVPRLVAADGQPRVAALRVALTRGPWDGLEAPGDAAPGLAIVVRALPAEPPAPARLVTVDQPRIDPASPLAGHKTLSFLPFVLARRAARAAGGDMALLRTTSGDVAEADAASVFCVRGGVCVTPSLDRGVLPGITRARVLAALRGSARKVEERPVSPEEARASEEVLLTSSLGGVRAVRSLDGRDLGPAGPVQRWLSACVPSPYTDRAPGSPAASMLGAREPFRPAPEEDP